MSRRACAAVGLSAAFLLPALWWTEQGSSVAPALWWTEQGSSVAPATAREVARNLPVVVDAPRGPVAVNQVSDEGTPAHSAKADGFEWTRLSHVEGLTPAETPIECAARDAAPRGNASTLVILIGNARGGELAWSSLRRHVLEPLGADLALLFGRAKVPRMLCEMSHHIWQYEEPRDWGDAFDARARELGVGASRFWRRPGDVSKLYGGIYDSEGNRTAGSGAILVALRHFLARDHASVLQRYRRLVLTRSDHYYACAHTATFPAPGEVLLPDGERHGGYSDRHHVVHSQGASTVIDVLSWLVAQDDFRGNIESAVAAHWKHARVVAREFDRSMFTVHRAQDVALDGPWNRHFKDRRCPELRGLFIHYPREYERAKHVCGHIK